MPFSVIDSNSIKVGDAIKAELFTKIKDNFDDHESRINALSVSAGKVTVFKYLMLNGSNFPTATGLDYFQAIEDFTLTSAVIRIFEKGSLTGAVEIDVKKSVTNMDNSSFSTVFTTKPKIDYSSASDYGFSINQAFNSGQIDIKAGDILRLDITETPSNGVLPKMQLIIYGEV